MIRLRKTISLIAAICMLLAALPTWAAGLSEPAPAPAAEEISAKPEAPAPEAEPDDPEPLRQVYSGTCGADGDNLTWTLDTETGVLQISGTGAMKDYSSSSAPWYSYRSYVKTAIIGSGVTSIGDDAFYYCTALTSVTIPDSVTIIGSWAFDDCSSLTSVTIGNGVTSIGSWAFDDCSSLISVNIYDIAAWCGISFSGSYSNPLYYAHRLYLNGTLVTDLVIPDSVTSIGGCAFEGCSSLTSVTIPDSVTGIGGSAFRDCSSLTSVNIYDIAAWCGISFSGSYSNPLYYALNLYLNGVLITDLVIPDGVTSIGNSAFYNCTSLTSVTIPDSVTSIGNSVFSGCSSLTSVTIGNGVTSIGNYAFYNCSSLTSVTIPDGVASISVSAFFNCTSLTEIKVDSSNPNYKDINGVLFNKAGTMLIQYPAGKSGEYMIPDSVTSIGNYAFYGCSSLTSVTIPDSVTSIGNYAFENCTSLTSVTIGNGVTSIGNYAFWYCTALTSVTIPDSVTSIGERAFSGCSSLTSVTIGNGVTSIGYSAFRDCSSLTSVYITDIASWCGMTFSEAYSNPLYYAHSLYLNGTLVTDLVIPDSVTSIRNHVFFGSTSLTSLTIGNGVTSIGSSVFRNCTSLTSVTIPASVTNIGTYSFESCSSLTSVTIGNGVTSIGGSAFRNCTSLTSATFLGAPPSSFGSSVFSNCASGFTIYYTAAHASEWAPNGETTWNGYNIEMIASYTVSYTGVYTDTVEVFAGEDAVLPVCDIPGIRYTFTVDGEPWDGTNITGDVTVVVGFEEDYCTITFTGAYTGTVTVEYGGDIALPVYDSATICYTFTVDGSEFCPENITGDVTVTVSAALIRNTYHTVTFICMDGEVISTQTVQHGQAATIPDAPVVPGYRFVGWDRDVEMLSSVTYSCTRYAVYEEITGPQGIVGDANGDGVIAFADVAELYSLIFAGSAFTPEQQRILDVNGDGSVSFADVAALYNYVLTGQTA